MKKLQGENFGIEATEERRYLPSFSITADDLPAVKNWTVGKSYDLKIKVRMKSLEERDTEKKKKTRADLEVQAIEVEEKDYEKEYADKRSKK